LAPESVFMKTSSWIGPCPLIDTLKSPLFFPCCIQAFGPISCPVFPRHRGNCRFTSTWKSRLKIPDFLSAFPDIRAIVPCFAGADKVGPLIFFFPASMLDVTMLFTPRYGFFCLNGRRPLSLRRSRDFSLRRPLTVIPLEPEPPSRHCK